MAVQLVKMHGLGNDYVVLDCFNSELAGDAAAFSRLISDRHRGVGSDGLILVQRPTDSENHARMEMYNADGSRAQMCGNGIRCVAKYVYDRGLVREPTVRVETDAGLRIIELSVGADGRAAAARVDMGRPRLVPADIPIRAEGDQAVEIMPTPRPDGWPADLRITAVSMGNPHAVTFVSSLAQVDLPVMGPALEHSPQFPERVNVHLVELVDRETARVLTWERGSGATQACGTGACAVLVAGVLTDRLGRAATLRLPGGDLFCEWDQATDHVFMSGEAVEVFTGHWPGPVS